MPTPVSALIFTKNDYKMGSQQNFNKHQNFNLPNIFSELLELYGSQQNLPFCQSYDGNSFSIIDHLEAEDHDDQQPEKSSKSAEDFTTNLAVGTEFPSCSDGLQHVLYVRINAFFFLFLF